MAGSARYSEADRRGRNSIQDVTNIGVAGRRTGLRVDGARRDSQGFENESAFFSPTTTAKKANGTIDISSAKSAQSATGPATGSYDDMDLEASSAQDVTAALRRRSEGPKSPSRSRRSMSPTKTHLNSPALRVRSNSRHPVSPPKSALRSPARPTTAPAIEKVARKLDFSRTDPGAQSDDEQEEEIDSAHNAKKTASKAAAPRSTIGRSKSLKRTSLEPAEFSDTDQTERRPNDSQPPEAAQDLSADQVDGAPLGSGIDQEVDGFDEFIHDQIDPEEEPKAQNGAKKTFANIGRSPKTSVTDAQATAPSPPAVQREESESDINSSGNDLDAEEPAANEARANSKKKTKTRARAAPSNKNGDDEADQPPAKKRGRPKKADKATTSEKNKVAPRPSMSPSRAVRETSHPVSPQHKWRETVDRTTQQHGDDDDGVRRSKRFKIAPLAHWLGEKVIYGPGERRKTLGGTVGFALPEVKGIIHVDLVESEKRRKTRHHRSTSQARSTKTKRRKDRGDLKEESESESDYGGEDWEDTIIVEAPVRSFEDQHELVKKVLAIPASAYEPRPVVGQNIFFQKTLAEEPHFAAGVLDIPAGAGKPPKPSRQNTMFFFIFSGYVEVKIHDVVFRLRKGGQFTVPRGNFYEISNIGKKDARLFFSQSTDTLANHMIAHPEAFAKPTPPGTE